MNKKSVWAILAGILVTVVVTTLVDIVLHATQVYPPMDEPLTDKLAMLATSYRTVISIGAAWLTARLAPNRPLRHALLLGCVGTVLGLIGVVTTWDKGMGPHWYPIVLAVLAIPQCWLGGKLYEMRERPRD